MAHSKALECFCAVKSQGAGITFLSEVQYGIVFGVQGPVVAATDGMPSPRMVVVLVLNV